jgi:hypothetical protein
MCLSPDAESMATSAAGGAAGQVGSVELIFQETASLGEHIQFFQYLQQVFHAAQRHGIRAV